MKATLKQCIECPMGTLRPLWKSNPPLCKTHAHYRSAKKQIAEKRVVDGKADKDERFYKFVWANKNHVCEECGKQLTDMKRWYMHHVLPKAKFPYFRFDSRNIIILCYTHHNEIESAVSAPKMKVYEHCEKLKEKLLNTSLLEFGGYDEKLSQMKLPIFSFVALVWHYMKKNAVALKMMNDVRKNRIR